MVTVEQQKQGKELIKTLTQRAWESASFKEQLVQDPIYAIELITGNKVPDNLKVLVEDQTDDAIIYLNVPAKPDYSELELTDEQLEIVAGGEVMCLGAWVAVGCISLLGGAVVGYAVGQAVKQ